MPRALDLHDRHATLEFILAHVAFLPDTFRKKVEDRLAATENGRKLHGPELLDLANDVARKSWAGHRALEEFLKTKNGCDEEWRFVLADVSSGTAHLLERFRHGTKCPTLDAVLAHPESGSAFHEVERLEIAEVRRRVHERIWKITRKALTPQLKKNEEKLAAITSRFDALREIAETFPEQQDEILSKLSRFEDELYFGEKELDPSVLDQEIRLYREAKELPIE